MATHGILLVAVVTMACGGSALQVHARVAHVTGQVLESSGAILRERRMADLQKAVASAQYREDAQAAVLQVKTKWEPPLLAYDAARRAYNTWIDWLLVYVERDAMNAAQVRALIKDLVEHWAAFVTAAKTAGLTLRGPPDVLTALLELGDET